jgi:hypothetical protein
MWKMYRAILHGSGSFEHLDGYIAGLGDARVDEVPGLWEGSAGVGAWLISDA